MIIYHPKEVVIFTPGKCASTSVRLTLLKEVTEGIEFVIGPQGYFWREHGIDSYKDSVGKHSVSTPFNARNYTKYILYRQPFDRFVSFWQHYCKYSKHEVDFPTFVSLVEKWRAEPVKDMWFYTWRMDEIVKECGQCGLIWYNQLNTLSDILGIKIDFPKLHDSVHEPWETYYTPELYRRVLEIA